MSDVVVTDEMVEVANRAAWSAPGDQRDGIRAALEAVAPMLVGASKSAMAHSPPYSLKDRLRASINGPDIHPGYYRRDAADALAEIERLEGLLRCAEQQKPDNPHAAADRRIADAARKIAEEKHRTPSTHALMVALVERFGSTGR